MSKSRLRLLSAIVIASVTINFVGIPVSTHFLGTELNLSDEAYARSGGGRSGGGSFRRSSPPRSNSSPSRSQQRSTDQDSQPSYRQSDPYYRQPGPVIVPIPVPAGQPGYNYNNNPGNNNSGYNNPNNSTYDEPSSLDIFLGFMILGLMVGIPAFIAWKLISWLLKSRKGVNGSGLTELENDIVTVTKLQVALLAQARDVQNRLNQVTEAIDTSTPQGLAELLQESVLALLRTPENWSHVASTSQTVRSREQAEALFNQLSVGERSKFSAETFVNVGGRIRRQQAVAPGADQTAAFIVVTLLIGTENDQPLFGDVRSTEALTAALQKVAAVPPEALSVFEVLWSPQEESDSLTYDELLTEYSDMVQI